MPTFERKDQAHRVVGFGPELRSAAMPNLCGKVSTFEYIGISINKAIQKLGLGPLSTNVEIDHVLRALIGEYK